MDEVVGISFQKNGKIYYFSCNDVPNLSLGVSVIVETEKGEQYGIVRVAKKKIDEKDLGLPLKKVIRLATENDHAIYLKNQKDAEKALFEARKIAMRLKLPMKIISASFMFDRSQLLFNFLADERIDFREMAKKLAQIYKTRIELRQIGVRDKAKEIGGIGPCGRFLCCSTFLTDFSSVSINMAKNQMLALNPTKINGVCGRLLCCLNYEDLVYSELKSKMPNIGDHYRSGEVFGKVIDIHPLRGSIVVQTKDQDQIEVVNEKWKF
ncbi:MAG: regulatory iron-sulfur-containing complex subunit RicT [bacterium]|nr:regulatory iron-sulfur-containing complex subunit RicT [bacterium]